MKKRIISILLAVVMVVGLLPVAALADYVDWENKHHDDTLSTSDYFTNDFFDWKDLKVYTDDDGDITGISAAAWYNFNQADCIKDRDIGFYVVETTVDPVEKLYEKGNLGVVQFDAVMENVGKRIDKGKSDGVRQWVTFSLTADECAGMTQDKEYNIWIWTRSGDANTENSFESKMGTMTAITIKRYVRLDGGTGSTAADYVPDRTINSMNIKGQKLSAAWKTYGAGVLNTSLSNEEATTSSNTIYNLYFDLDSDSLPAAPQLSVTEPTDDYNNDGTITVVDYADGDTIEYSADGTNWTDVSGSVIDNLAPGEYSVRRKATEDAPGSKSAVATLILHDHNFTYAANGNQIVATCNGIEGGHTTTLKLNAEESVQYTEDPYDGASISGWSVFYSALAAAPAISYVGRDGTIYEESTTAPTEVGTYTARITLSNVPMTSGGTGDVTATADFEIVDIPTIARLVTSEGVTVSVENTSAYPWDFCADDPKGIQSTNQNINGSASTITFTFTSPKDFEFSFKYRVSSEANYDTLTINLDGATIANRISGTAANEYSYSSILSAGTHTLTASYSKDGSMSGGSDTAYITDIAAYYHSFTYGVDESTPSVLTATCAGRRCCGGYNTTPLTLTLTGKGFNSAELAAWRSAGAAEPVIKYYKSDDTQHSTAVKLTEPGSYVAVATIGEGESALSVSSEFELTEKDFGIITKNIITDPAAAAEAGVTVHNVTWNDEEDYAVFSGNSSYLEIPSELAAINASNGFVVSTEVWIDNSNAAWARIFDFNNGSTSKYFTANAGNSSNASLRTMFKDTNVYYDEIQMNPSNPASYRGTWVKLIWVVRSDGSVRLYHDDTGDANCIAQTGGTATTKKILTDNTSYTKCLIGASAFGSGDGYFKGKMKSFSVEPIVHNFAYDVDENDASVLTATCSGENCYAQHDAGTPSISLTLTLTGKDFDAAELAAWISAGAAEPVIKYYKSDDTERTTPVGLTESGSYVAVATVGTATAEKAFTITMATEDTTTTGTYQPTNIINGGFDDCPWMGFKIGSTVYTKEDLIAGHSFYGGITVSSLIYNGPNKGWNTTAMRVFDDGKLFDWTKCANGTLASHAIGAQGSDNPYNGNLGRANSDYSFIEMNGYDAAVFYQDLYTVGGDVIRWTLNHGARSTGPNPQNISVEIGAPKRDQDGNIVNAHGSGSATKYTEIEESSKATYTHNNGVTNGSTNSGYANSEELKNLSLSSSSQLDKWYDARGVYVIPEGQTVTRFAFISDSNNADGNLLDSITFSTLIGNLQAVLQDDGSVLVTGYWGDDDPTKALIIKTGDNVLEVNMNSVLNKHFSFVLSAEAIGENTSVEIYHQDYESAKRTVLIDRTQANIVELTRKDASVERYLTLTEAVEVVQNNEKITILRDIDEEVSVSKNITFRVDANGKQFDRNSIQAGPGYTLTKVTAGNVTTYTVESIITIAAGEGDPIPVEVKIVEETEKEEDQKGSVKENLSGGATEEQKNAAALIIGSLSDGKDGKNNSDIVDLTEVVKNMVNNLSVDQLKEIAAKQNETSGQEQGESKAAKLEALLEKASDAKEKGSTVDINMNLVTDVDVDVTDVQVDQSDDKIIKTFTLDIMPWYTMKVTTTITPDDGEATSESVTVAEKQKLEVTETTVVSFPAPNGFEYTNGMLVYVEHKKEDGTTYSYKADYDPTTGMISFTNPHGFSEFKMMTIEEESLGGADFTATLNLADSIGIILYVNNPTKAPENYVVTATYKGVSTSTKLSDVTPKVENEKTKYGIVIADCAAAEMFETVHVVVTYDGYNIKEFDYSVYDYCNSKINDTNTDGKLKELCKAALDYGCYAKTFFEYEEMVPADSDYVPSDVSQVEATGESASRSDLCAGIVSVSATLSLESRTKIIFYLTPDQGYSEESYNYSVSGGDLQNAAPAVTLGSDGRIRVEVLGIAAAKLGKVYTLTVKPTGEGGSSMTVSYSPMTYAQTKQNSMTPGLPDLVKSLYVYYQKAAAYFTK